MSGIKSHHKIKTDTIADMRLVSIKHYLAAVDSSFSSFNAKADTFNGARPNWPEASFTSFGVEAAPAIVQNNENGISFVVCGKNMHPMEKVRMLHVPQNPYLKAPLNEVCTHAPLILTANVVRNEQLHKHNTSFRVIRQFGNSGGLSTVTLTRKMNSWIPLTEETLDAATVTIANRPRIHHYIEQNIGAEKMAVFHERNELLEKQNKAFVDKCKDSGTFVDIPDAVQDTRATVLQGHEKQNLLSDISPIGEMKYKKKSDDTLLFIRGSHAGSRKNTTSSFKHLVFPLMNIGGSTKGAKTHLLCSILGNCRTLHRTVIENGLWLETGMKQNHRKALETVQIMIRQVFKGCTTSRPKIRAQIASVENNITQVQDNAAITSASVHDHETVHTTVGKFISEYSQGRVRHLTNIPSNEQLDDEIFQNAETLICTTPRIGRRFSRIEKEIGNGKFDLQFSGCLTYLPGSDEFISEFVTRWTRDEKWVKMQNGQIDTAMIRENDTIIFGRYNVVIYERRDAHSQMDEYQLLNWTGGQQSIFCAVHKFPPLLREPHNPSDWCSCSWPGCNLHGIWRCGENAHVRKVQCATAICRKHFKAVVATNENVFLLPERTNFEQNEQEEDDEDIPIDSNEEEDANIPEWDEESLSDNEHEEEQTFVENMCHVEPNDISMSENQGSDFQPAFEEQGPDRNDRVRSSYILNNLYQVMGRFGISRRSPIALQRLLQGIYAANQNSGTSTLYVEGELFPWVFPFEENGAVIGALPHSLYVNPLSQRREKGVATLLDHLHVRIRDGSLLTASEPDYLCWVFDIIMNYIANYNSIELALRKGPEFLMRQTKGDGLNIGTKETGMMFDTIESKGPVNELAALVKDQGKWDYFITITCNDEYTPGVATLNKHVQKVATSFSIYKKERLRIVTAAMPAMLRAWHRFVRYFFKWVMDGPVPPLGKVKALWYRFEFQDAGAPGNKPHVHAGVTVQDSSISEQDKASIVHAHDNQFNSTFLGYELRDCMEKGIVETVQQYVELREFIRRVQNHDCAAAKYRCHKRIDENGNTKCRVARQTMRTESEFVPAKNMYDSESLEILHSHGLAYRDPDTNEIRPNGELVGGKWYYRSPGGSILPTVPSIAWSVRAATNVQKCDRKFLMSYLLKYNAGKDEKAQVKFFARPNSDILQKEDKGFGNIKINSQRYLTEKENKTFQPLAREVGLPEISFVLSELEYVHSSANFIHVPTFPPEHRMAVRKKPKSLKRISSDGNNYIAIQRIGLPPWRRFSANQMRMIIDHDEGVHYPDKTTSFSLRPPELRVITALGQYSKWFSTKKAGKLQDAIHADIEQAGFVDGALRQTRVRAIHIPEVVEYLTRTENDIKTSASAKEVCTTLLEKIFNPLMNMYHSWDMRGQFPKNDISRRFVDESDKRPAVPVYSSVSPKNATKFLIHILLSMGRYETELDLYTVPHMRESFYKAGLIESRDAEGLARDVKALTKRYITEQLMWLPITNRSFCKFLKLSVDVLQNFFIHKTLHYDQPPLIFMKNIQDSYREDVQQVLHDQRLILVRTLQGLNIKGFPAEQALINQEEIAFRPVFDVQTGLSSESLEEQKQVFAKGKSKIDDLNREDISFEPGMVIVGPPGSGKTHILNLLMTYALSKRKNVIVTAMAAERAREMGGIHLHQLLKLNVSGATHSTATQEAEKSLKHLASDPIKVACLRELDVLCIDEIGFINKEFLSVIDIVLRRIRCTTVPFGGVLILASGDYCQLPPVCGDLVWNSTDFITVLDPFILKHLVRSVEDEQLQRIINILRQPIINETEQNEVLLIIAETMKDAFCKSFADIPGTYLKVLSKRAAVRLTAEQNTENFKRVVNTKNIGLQPGNRGFIDSAIFTAVDEVATNAGSWGRPDSSTSHLISKGVKEEKELFVFEGAIMRYTRNEVEKGLCQGQLVRITKIIKHQVENKPIGVFAQTLPNGAKDWSSISPNNALHTKRIPLCNSIEIVVGKGFKKARRFQLPLVHFGATTIHKAMGQTCDFLATRLSVTDTEYKIWSREQLLVVLSRVRKLSDLKFVGEMKDTLAAIKEAMTIIPRSWERIENFLHERSTGESNTQRVISWRGNIDMTEIDNELPGEGIGAVYCLASTKYPFIYYVGQTGNLERRLSEHNSVAGGSTETNKNNLKPWAVVGYMFGFDGAAQDEINRKQREMVETEIHWKIGRITKRVQHALTSFEVRQLILQLMRARRDIFRRVKLTWKDMSAVRRIGTQT